jgi:hypothetical protein
LNTVADGPPQPTERADLPGQDRIAALTCGQSSDSPHPTGRSRQRKPPENSTTPQSQRTAPGGSPQQPGRPPLPRPGKMQGTLHHVIRMAKSCGAAGGPAFTCLSLCVLATRVSRVAATPSTRRLRGSTLLVGTVSPSQRRRSSAAAGPPPGRASVPWSCRSDWRAWPSSRWPRPASCDESRKKAGRAFLVGRSPGPGKVIGSHDRRSGRMAAGSARGGKCRVRQGQPRPSAVIPWSGVSETSRGPGRDFAVQAVVRPGRPEGQC